MATLAEIVLFLDMLNFLKIIFLEEKMKMKMKNLLKY
jgi:hypothetical protein